MQFQEWQQVKSPSPAFSLYPKDILSDENAAAMTLEERGAYITLICHAWLEGSIPKDMVKLGRLLKIRPAKLAKIWPAIAPCWGADPCSETRLIQSRLEKERERQRERSVKQSLRGKSGGRPLKSTNIETRGLPADNPRESRTKPGKSLPSPSPFPSANVLTEPPTPKGADVTRIAARLVPKRAGRKATEPHPAVPRFVRAFNGSFGRHLGVTGSIEAAFRRRESDGHEADALVALPILLAAQVTQGLDEIKGGISSLVPSWLLRDGTGRYGGQDGGTRNTKDWVGTILGRADQTCIAPELLPLVEELGLHDVMHKLGVKRRKPAC